MKAFKVLLICALLTGASLAATCTNPLLQRADIQARFGAGNILNASMTAGTSLPICSFLNGKDVCVSQAGFEAWRSNFDSWKSDFVSRGQDRNAMHFAGLNKEANTDATECVQTYLYFTYFAAFSVTWQLSVTTGTIDYTALYAKAQQDIPATAQAEAAQFGGNFLDQLNDLENDLVAQKATCAAKALKGYLYSTCLAADANWQGQVTGDSSNPTVFVKTGYCDTVKDSCIQYFTDVKTLGLVATFFDGCSNADFQKVASILSGQPSDDNNAQLNAIWTRNKAQYNSEASFTAPKVAATLQCDNVTKSASDCNFICKNVLTASGFKEEAFTDLEVVSSRRRLQQDDGAGSIQESDGTNVRNPDTVIPDSEEGSISAESQVGTGSNGVVMFANLALLFAFAFITLF